MQVLPLQIDAKTPPGPRDLLRRVTQQPVEEPFAQALTRVRRASDRQSRSEAAADAARGRAADTRRTAEADRTADARRASEKSRRDEAAATAADAAEADLDSARREEDGQVDADQLASFDDAPQADVIDSDGDSEQIDGAGTPLSPPEAAPPAAPVPKPVPVSESLPVIVPEAGSEEAAEPKETSASIKQPATATSQTPGLQPAVIAVADDADAEGPVARPVGEPPVKPDAVAPQPTPRPTQTPIPAPAPAGGASAAEAPAAVTVETTVTVSVTVESTEPAAISTAPKPTLPTVMPDQEAPSTQTASPTAATAAMAAPATPANGEGAMDGDQQRQQQQGQPNLTEAAPKAAPVLANAVTFDAPTPAPQSGIAAAPPQAAPLEAPTPNAQAQPPQAEADAEGADTTRLNAARVARGLQNAVQQNGGSVTLRLTPSDLGTVRVQMQLQGTSVTAHLHTETEAARSLLSQQLSQLRSALEGQGLQVDRLQVQVMQQPGQSSTGNQQNDFTGQDGRSRGFAGHDQRGGDGSPRQRETDQQRRERFERLLFSQVA